MPSQKLCEPEIRCLKHILSVGLYGPLVHTRQLLLEQYGHSVSSATDFRDAVAQCSRRSYDLLILGHSIPDSEKDDLVRAFREHCAAPVLCLRRHLEQGARTAEYHVAIEDPADLARTVASVFILNQLVHDLLKNAITVTNADFGNIQLLDGGSTTLRIVAQQGFGPAFLEFFSQVKAEGSACGHAMRSGTRVISADVATDTIYTESARAVMLAAQAHACQSTPILSTSGHLLGMVSTHYKSKTQPSETQLARLNELVRAAADQIFSKVAALKPWPSEVTVTASDSLSAWAELRRAARATTHLYDLVLQPSGLRASQFMALKTIADAGELPQWRFARDHTVAVETLSRRLASLRKKGLVSVRTGKEHREQLYRLTEKGEETLRAVLPYWERAQQRFKQTVGDSDWQSLMDVCRRAVEAAQKAELLRAPNPLSFAPAACEYRASPDSKK